MDGEHSGDQPDPNEAAFGPSLGTILRGIAARTRTDPSAIEPAPQPPDCLICNDTGWLRHDVPLGHPDYGRAWPCNCRIERTRRRNAERFRHLSEIPDQMLRMTFSSYIAKNDHQHAALHAALRYAEDPQGWIAFVGDPGCGKTHLAVAIAQARIEAGQQVYFRDVPRMLNDLRAGNSADSPTDFHGLLNYILDVPVLVLDDLGIERMTEWARDTIYQIINHRYVRQSPTIITANGYPPTDSGDPIASRMNDTLLVELVPIIAPDHRLEDRAG